MRSWKYSEVKFNSGKTVVRVSLVNCVASSSDNHLQKPWYLNGFFGYFDKNKNGLRAEEEWSEGIDLLGLYSLDGGLFAIKPEGNGE